MNVVDSSGWLEYFADGRNAEFFAEPIEHNGVSGFGFGPSEGKRDAASKTLGVFGGVDVWRLTA